MDTFTEGNQYIGTVVSALANFYSVRLNGLKEEKILLCTRRTRLKKIGQKVMVGDKVLVEEPHNSDGRGAISEVLRRKNELKRPSIANVDQIVLLFALEEPTLSPWQLSRSLVMAESTGLELCICLNKMDLISTEEIAQWRDRLAKWGYDPIFISVANNIAIDTVKAALKDKISIVVGNSGVGKSSLINKLLPEANLRVGKVSGKLKAGAHTTRHVELFALPEGGFIADSPGFNQLSLDCLPENLPLYFREAKELLSTGSCQFSDCHHRDEPNCLVRGDWERYEHYLKFLEEAIALEEERLHTKDESSLKMKIKADGKQQLEPKLESKKYRRSSRRERNQNLHSEYNI